MISVIIVSFNTAALLRACVASALEALGGEAEIIVVDNASSDDSVEMVRGAFPSVRLLALTDNLGFGAANNVGVAAASAPYVMLLNSDALLPRADWSDMLRYLDAHPDVGCLGPRIVLPGGQDQPRTFGALPTLRRVALQSVPVGAALPGVRALEGVDGRARRGGEDRVGWISGVCMVMRRRDFLAVGGFDPAIFMYCEDIDLCWRLSARGLATVRLDRFTVIHHGGGSSPSVETRLRNAVLQQRNLLAIIGRRSGPGTARAAAALIALGLTLRLGAGVALAPGRGVGNNVLLRSSWLRLADLAASTVSSRGAAGSLVTAAEPGADVAGPKQCG